jgi:carbon storage regulator
MLVLSRKEDESVVVGGANCLERVVIVTVLEVRGKGAKLGFEANKDVPVHREEVWARPRKSGQRDPPTVGPDRTGSRKRMERQACFPERERGGIEFGRFRAKRRGQQALAETRSLVSRGPRRDPASVRPRKRPSRPAYYTLYISRLRRPNPRATRSDHPWKTTDLPQTARRLRSMSTIAPRPPVGLAAASRTAPREVPPH